jgi:uncharacterized membrane protein YeaQ/YmgE (transglycosylase-associated protein family)
MADAPPAALGKLKPSIICIAELSQYVPAGAARPHFCMPPAVAAAGGVSSRNRRTYLTLIAAPHGGTMHILWIIIIGFVAGIVARFLAPGPNNPAGFILTTLLGIAGAFVATFIGQMIGWYGPNQGAGLIGAVVGALLVLFIWHRLVTSHAIPDPGDRRYL